VFILPAYAKRDAAKQKAYSKKPVIQYRAALRSA
jgi:hypothetical protein